LGFFVNYSKPGKGVSKEEAAKRNYFDILGRRFWDLVKLNLLFVLCNIVFIGAVVLFSMPYIMELDTVIDALIWNRYILLPPGPFIPFMFMGPFIAGFTYVLRNWSRQEHAFLVSDFFEHTKKNWKQGLALSIISTVATYLYLTALLFYLKTGVATEVILFLGAVVAVVLLIMGFYTYPMVVTFDMKLIDIIKNALIFTMAKLPQNLFFFIIIAAVHILLLWYIPFAWIVLMVFILIAWSGYTMNFYVWHVINKYMMPQANKQEEENVFDNKREDGLD